MLEQVHVGVASIEWHERTAGAERMAQLRTLAAPLLRHPEKGKAMKARESQPVREHFQLPRLIADESQLYGALLRT
jgi:hypothetical protein